VDDRRLDRLENIMERGFATLADLQRETNDRLGSLEGKVDVLTGRVDVLTERVVVIEHVLQDRATQLVAHGRVMRLIADKHDVALDDLRKRLEAVEKRLGPEH
jgi:chaperonin cofactor prefoldin